MLVTATRIHNGKNWLPQGSVIDVTEDGTITGILDNPGNEDVKHYDGIICPGFVNVHCHLELSHMKGLIPEHTGLIPFLKQVAFTRNNHTEEEKALARHEAFRAMLANGIVAVGDIANTNDTLDLRATGKMLFHSFVESIGFSEQPQKQFEYAVNTYKAFTSAEDGHRQSIVPHAPYSVSKQLFQLINGFDTTSVISIHNQESRAEDQYYTLKKGDVTDLLQTIGINDDFFQPSGKSSLQTYLPLFAPLHPMIFVHNTYTTTTDIEYAKAHNSNVHWCLCPNANLYIENTLPDIDMLIQHSANICIGTDSLSSNHRLSVLAELHTIKNNFPSIDWEVLLSWATYNGAKALQMDRHLGSIEVSKKPGLVLLNKQFNIEAVLA